MDTADQPVAQRLPPRVPLVLMDRFPYLRIQAMATYADPVPYVYRPVVPLIIHGWTKDFPSRGILDTGSTETILPLWLWQDGHVDPLFRDDEVGELEAANGTTFPVRYATVDLSIRLKHRRHRWHAKVGFTEARDDVLLGDAGFLRYFKVGFNRHQRYATIRVSTPLPARMMPRPSGRR